jgi:glycosyltransferase involved in cell wall biosynthesis
MVPSERRNRRCSASNPKAEEFIDQTTGPKDVVLDAMTEQRISIVLPTYNEDENLQTAVDRALEALPGLVSEFEVIVVDDGSTDGTREIALRLIREHHPTVRLAAHPTNRGYGAALRTGFALARFDLVFFTDSDNQFDIRDLRHFLPLVDEYDLIVGFRVYRYDPVLRSVLSWIYNRILRVLFRVRVRDVDCSFKLFRREVLEKIVVETDDFFVDAELVAKARRWNFRLLEKGVRHYPRPAGETTVHASHIPRTLKRIALMWKQIYFPSKAHLEWVAELQADHSVIGTEVLPERSESPTQT